AASSAAQAKPPPTTKYLAFSSGGGERGVVPFAEKQDTTPLPSATQMSSPPAAMRLAPETCGCSVSPVHCTAPAAVTPHTALPATATSTKAPFSNDDRRPEHRMGPARRTPQKVFSPAASLENVSALPSPPELGSL